MPPVLSPQPLIRGPLATREECAGCPFAGPDDYAAKPVVGIGPRRPKYIALGEGPGGAEIRTGEPFVGPSGQIVTAAIQKTGCRREDIWIGNVTLCVPYGKDKDKAMPKALAHCRARVLRELNALPNVPLIVMGKWAMQFFLGEKMKITEVAGCYFDQEIEGLGRRQIIPTIHPAHILRGGGGEGGGGAHAVDLLYLNLIYDFAKVKRLAEGTQEPFKFTTQREFTNAKRADALVESIAREARRLKRVTLDVETVPIAAGECTSCANCEGHSAVEPYFAKLYAVGLGTPARAISVAWRVLTPYAKDVIRRLMADVTVEKVIQNKTYDGVVMARHGMPLAGVVQCTLLQHHNAFPGLDHRLQRIVSQFYLVRPWKAEFRHGKDTPEELHRYNCLRHGTPVVLADGTTLSIERIVRRKLRCRVLSWDPHRGIVTHSVVRWHHKRVRGQYWMRIALADGGRLEVTPDHEVYLADGRKVAAATLRVGDNVMHPEVLLDELRTQAILGTLLGDTTLTFSPVYRKRRQLAPSAALSGGHVDAAVVRRKVAFLSPIAVAGPRYAMRGYSRGWFHPFRTRNLHQLAGVWSLLYDATGKRRLYVATVARLGSIGLAWWFMDDGCVQKSSYGDTICLAACRYPRSDVEALRAWLSNRYGSVWVGRDRVLRFSRRATVRFCAEIAPHVFPECRYKLPRTAPLGSWPSYADVPNLNVTCASAVRVTGVTEYTPVIRTRDDALRAETRYCLTVAGTHNFFTAHGLVANCRDVQSTATVNETLTVIVKKSDAEHTYEIDRRMADIATKMTLWGIPVDLEENRRLASLMKPKIDELEASLIGRISDGEVKGRFMESLATERAKRKRKTDEEDFMLRHALRLEEAVEEIDDDGINIGSADQIIALLKACGVPLMAVTKSGKPSTKKEVLMTLVDYPVVRDLIFFRAFDKLHGTFVEPMPKWVDRQNRFHVVWGVNMITGRWNSKRNIQNLHEGSEKRGTPNIRSQFVAPPGWVIICGDKAQLEMRIIAQMSKDPYLLKAFREDVDIHSEFSTLVFPNFAGLPKKCPVHPKHNPECPVCKQAHERKEQRNHMKRGEYGYVYRAVPTTVWKSAFIKEGHDVPLSLVLKMYRVLKARMPAVEHWHAEKYRHVAEKLELREPLLGRRRTFPLGQIDATVVANFDVQAMGASMMAMGIDRFDQAMQNKKRYGEVQYLIHGHDSFTILAKEDKADVVKAKYEECFDDEITLDGVTLKYPTETKIGRRLSEV